MSTGADIFTLNQTAFFPNIVFAAAYTGALLLLVIRAASGRSRTALLLPIFVHIALRLTSYVIFMLAAKSIAGTQGEPLYAAQMCWLPALTAFTMAHCAATAVYIAKGPYQERVRFGQLPMSMRAAFIAPHILLLIGGLAGLYSPGAEAYKTNDGICVTVLLIDVGAICYYHFARKFLREPAFFLLGTALLLTIAAAYRLAIASGAPGTVFPTALLAYIFECVPQTLATYLWVILKVKKILGLGMYANSVMTMPECQPSPMEPQTPMSAPTQSARSYDNQTLGTRSKSAW